MNDIIITVENGMVAEVYGTRPINVIVVDRDVIKRGDTLNDIMVKTVTFMPVLNIHPDETGRTVQHLVHHKIKTIAGASAKA